MVFLGFGKYARADRIYALEPLTGRRPRRRAPHARVDRGRLRADHRLAHRAGDPRGDGLARSGRRPRRRGRGARRADRRGRGERDGSTSATSRAAPGTCSRRRRAPETPTSSFEARRGVLRPERPRGGARAGRLHAPRRRRGRHDRRGRGLRGGRPGEPRLPRADAAQRGHVRPGRPRVRLPLLRGPLVPQLRLRR